MISVLFLTVAVVAKTLLVYYLGWAGMRRRRAAAALAVLMLVAMPVLKPWRPQDIYLGQVTPNLWHNSTQIFALPFSLAAFVGAVALLRVPTRQRALLCGFLVLMSTLAKPNYTLALLPVLGLMLLWSMFRAKTRPKTQLSVVLLAFGPTALLLGYQYLVVFGSQGVRSTSVAFAPFVVWSAFTASIPASIGLSIAGPLAVLLALPRKWRIDQATVLAWLVLAVAVLQLALLAERFKDGTISLDGNFFWGSHSAIFMLFVVSGISLGRAFVDGPVSKGRRLALLTALVVLMLHAGTGLYYVIRVEVTGYPYSQPLVSASTATLPIPSPHVQPKGRPALRVETLQPKTVRQ